MSSRPSVCLGRLCWRPAFSETRTLFITSLSILISFVKWEQYSLTYRHAVWTKWNSERENDAYCSCGWTYHRTTSVIIAIINTIIINS